jgi:hypothetical protein
MLLTGFYLITLFFKIDILVNIIIIIIIIISTYKKSY